MATALSSQYFGQVAWDDSAEIRFPQGLPGFECETSLVALELEGQRPLVYLHSASDPGLCFLCLPVNVISSAFQIELTFEDRNTLLFGSSENLLPGRNLLALAVLCPSSGGVRANLSAPLLINLEKMVGMQRIPEGENTMHRFELLDSGEWVPSC